MRLFGFALHHGLGGAEREIHTRDLRFAVVPATDAAVAEPQRLHHCRIIDVAPVDHDWLGHEITDAR